MSRDSQYELAVKTMVRKLRGTRTQAQLSNDLGASFNIVNRWEKGTRSFYWQDFVEICQHFEFNIGEALEKSIHIQTSSYPSQKEVLKFLDTSSIKVIESQYSKQKFYRLLIGSSKLKFSDFLFFIDIVYGRVLRFLRCFLPKDDRYSLASLFNSEEEYTKLSSQNLQLFLTSQCIELNGYLCEKSGGVKFISERLKISREQVENNFQTLQKLGVIYKSGKLYKKVKKSVDFGASSSMNSRNICNLLRSDISEFSTNHSPQKEKHKAAFLTFPSNIELEQKVFELSRKYYVDLKNLVDADSSEKDRLSLVLVDLFKLVE